jgi:polysaccharide export outer membrane protein
MLHSFSKFTTAALVTIAAAVILFPSAVRAQTTSEEIMNATPIQSGEVYLKPGDLVRLRINREPEMSGEFRVDQGGVAVFPRIGEVMVLDDTAESLGARLVAEYRAFLREPAIEVTVLRRVNITGSVGVPGVYDIDPTMTVDDALATAGGVNPQGSRDNIEVRRDGAILTTTLNQSTAIGSSMIRSGDQIYVPEKSWVSRNAAIVAASISAMTAILIAAVINQN